MRRRLGAFAIVASAAVVLEAAPAAACLTPPPPLALSGVPEDGQTDVPTDVIPVFDVVPLLSAGGQPLSAMNFELIAETGAQVSVAVRESYVWHFELVPESTLAPRTKYSIRATIPASVASGTPTVLSLAFTTGDSLAATPEPPGARLQHYVSDPTDPTSCDPRPQGSCISFESGDPLVVVSMDQSGNQSESHYLHFDAFAHNLSGIEQGTDYDCVVLRTRAANGSLSAPATLCREDGEMLNVSGDQLRTLKCTEHGLELGAGEDAGGDPEPGDDEPRVVMTEGCGCVVAGGTERTSGVALLAGLLLLVAAAARRLSPGPGDPTSA